MMSLILLDELLKVNFQYDSLNKDIDRILKILTSIVKTLNEKVKKK